eukprot:14615254-Heterocapsa_arctica.AAC.1
MLDDDVVGRLVDVVSQPANDPHDLADAALDHPIGLGLTNRRLLADRLELRAELLLARLLQGDDGMFRVGLAHEPLVAHAPNRVHRH